MTAETKSQRTLRVRQIRSGIGFNKKQKATLRALGLERIGRVRELPDHPAVRGMVASVPHLVVIEGEGDREEGR
jgi:large subunit ribosomal protein L30